MVLPSWSLSYGFDGDSPAPPHVSSEWNSLEECTEEWGLLTRLLLPSDKFTCGK